jgi:predicted DNA binding CopG/RHH family protein
VSELPGDERQVRLEELRRRLRSAAEEGSSDAIDLEVEKTSAEDKEELERLVKDFQESRSRGEKTVSVTLRMRPQTVDRLRYEARRQGLRGYQTLMSQLIEAGLDQHDALKTELEAAVGPLRETYRYLHRNFGIDLTEEAVDPEDTEEEQHYYQKT